MKDNILNHKILINALEDNKQVENLILVLSLNSDYIDIMENLILNMK